jgi:hypothetical protein
MIPAWVVEIVHKILIAINFPGVPPPPFHG